MHRVLLLFIFCLTSLKSYSQTGGDNTYEFLNLVPSARVSGVGGNLLAVKDNDLQLAYHNPALLDSNMHNQLAFSYVNYFADINYGNIAYSRHYKKIGTFSGGMQYINYGSFIAAEASSEVTGEFTAGEYCFLVSYARPIDSSFSVGASLKTIYSSFESYTSFGQAIDLALTYSKPTKAFAAALLVKNAGLQYKSYNKSNREPLPFEIQSAMSVKLKHAPVRFSLAFENLQQWDIKYRDDLPTKSDSIESKFLRGSYRFGQNLARHAVIGAEFLLGKNFAIRVGYNIKRRYDLKADIRPALSGFSFGAGFKLYKFMLSYGRSSYSLAGASNHISIGVRFSDFNSKK